MKARSCFPMVVCLILTLVLSLVSACSPPAEKAVQSLLELTDHLGRTVTLQKVPERIVSLSPGNTEILFALGLDDRVVAVTDYCNYPPQAQEKPTIGGYSTPNIEEIVALSPDLILATSIHEKRVIPQLETKGLIVFAVFPQTLDEILDTITLVGELTGKEEEASRLVTEMRSRIKAVTDRTDKLLESDKPRVFFVTWHDPLKTPGSDTRQHELIHKAGGINIGKELTGYADIGLETVIQANPEVIIAGIGMGSGNDLPLQFALNEHRLRGTDALKNSRVYGVDADLANRPGPRITDALEQLAECIHPELFKYSK